MQPRRGGEGGGAGGAGGAGGSGGGAGGSGGGPGDGVIGGGGGRCGSPSGTAGGKAGGEGVFDGVGGTGGAGGEGGGAGGCGATEQVTLVIGLKVRPDVEYGAIEAPWNALYRLGTSFAPDESLVSTSTAALIVTLPPPPALMGRTTTWYNPLPMYSASATIVPPSDSGRPPGAPLLPASNATSKDNSPSAGFELSSKN
eukprot:scaffold104948_cov29-Tisochrysis_lutea.AAC.2